MEKRLFIAILLSVVFLSLYSFVIKRVFPEDPKAKVAAATSTSSSAARPANGSATPANTTSNAVTPAPLAVTGGPAPAAVGAVPATPVAAQELKVVTVDTPDYTARLSNHGAQLVSFRLKHYTTARHEEVELVKHREAGRIDYPFAIQSSNAAAALRLNSVNYATTDETRGADRVITFRYAGSDGLSATKTFRFNGANMFDFAVAVAPAIPYRIEVGPGIRTLDVDEKDSRIISTGNGVVQRDNSLDVVAREKAENVRIFGSNVQFVGIEDNYFLTALRPEKAGDALLHSHDFEPTGTNKEKRRDVYVALNATPAGEVTGSSYFGPKQADTLEKYGLEKTLQFGMFGIVSRVLLTALVWINRTTHNYGFAIIVLTIIIKILLYPLQHKSIVSMKKMQVLQPKMTTIRDKYKKKGNDVATRQKMNEEVMGLYQQEGINPMSGCWPMLLQLPILWGFYGLLSRAIELRGAPFIWWIHDLSAKDPYYITPILMAVTMFVQQQVTPATVDAAQKRMFMFLPLVFFFFFKEFPSGLVLYWLVQNVLTIVQQLIMNKYWKGHPDAALART